MLETNRPRLLPTSISNESYASITYHIDGELVPVLTVDMNGGRGIYFEHHIMLWKDTPVEITIKKLDGAFRRMFAGLPVFMTQTQSVGQIAFSRNGPGHILPMHMQAGQDLIVREHQFLAATDNMQYDFEIIPGLSNKIAGASGFLIDRFTCTQGEGILWLHGYGNVFEKVLQPGEQIDVEEGGWLYRDTTIQMETRFLRLATGLFASAGGLLTNRFTGPGRVGIQSFSVVANFG